VNTQQLLGTVFAIFILGMGFWGINRLMILGKSQSKQWGELFLQLMSDNAISTRLLLILVIILGESMLAASLVDDRTNVVARFITHIGIGFFSLIGAISFVKAFKSVGEDLSPFNFPRLLLKSLIALIYTALFIFGPMANTIIMANGYGQLDLIGLMWTQVFGNSTQYQYAVLYSGKSWPFNAWAMCNNALLSSILLNVVSMFLSFLEVLSALVSMKVIEPKAKKAVDGSKPTTTTSTVKPNNTGVQDGFTKIFTFYGYRDTILDSMLKIALSNVQKLEASPDNSNTVIQVMRNVATLVQRIASVRTEDESTLRDDIKTILGNSPDMTDNGLKGLRITFPRVS